MLLKYLVAVGALAVLVGCGSAATPTTPPAQSAATMAPTAAAAAKQAAGTVQAAATQVAPTVQAAATQLAPTVQAAATQAASAAGTAAPVVATAAAASPVQVEGIQLDPADTRIVLRNSSSAAVNVSGWTLQVGSATAALPSNAAVPPNGTLTVHAASGTSSGTNVYLGQAVTTLVMNLRPGARLALLDSQGRVVSEFTLG